MQRSQFEVSFFSIMLIIIISVSSTFFAIHIYNEFGQSPSNIALGTPNILHPSDESSKTESDRDPRIQTERNNNYQKVELGVKAVNITALTLNHDQNHGIYVSEVKENSPADKSNIKADDIITSIDRIKIDSLDGLTSVLHKFQHGDSSNITVIRNSEKIVLPVKF